MVVMGISITQAKAATVTYDVDATYVESYTSNTAAVDGTFALDTNTEAITSVDITLTGPSAFTFTTADIQTASYSPSAGNNTTVLIAASATDDLGCAAERRVSGRGSAGLNQPRSSSLEAMV